MKYLLTAFSTALVLLMVISLVSADKLNDGDQDGVADEVDQCLNTPALPKIKTGTKYAVLFSSKNLSGHLKSVAVDAQGCALDSDADSVADYVDYCPHNMPLEISAGVSKNGCARHSDGDGTPDYRDRCPGTAMGMKTDRYGCALIK